MKKPRKNKGETSGERKSRRRKSVPPAGPAEGREKQGNVTISEGGEGQGEGERPRVVKSQKEAARLLEITDRQLRNWIKQEPDFPKCDGGYDLEKIEAWRAAHARKGSAAAEQAAQLNLEAKQEELLIKRSDRLRKQRIEEKEQGNILPRAELTVAIREMVQLTRDRFVAMPKELARFVRQKDRRQYLVEATRYVEKVLNEFASMGQRLEARKD